MTGEASAAMGGILLFAFLLVCMWCWAVGNEAWMRKRWNAFLQLPRLRFLRRRFAPQVAFVQARLAPHGYLVLQLTVGALLLLGFSWLFGGIAGDVIHKDLLTNLDLTVAKWFLAHSTPALTRRMLLSRHFHDPAPAALAVLCIVGILVWRRDRYWLLCFCLVCFIPFGMLLNMGMKYALHRNRPTFDDSLLVMSSDSFPSGHVASVTLMCGFIAALLVARIPAWRWRVMILLIALQWCCWSP